MMPRIIAATTVPPKLPRPPSTAIANTRPMYSRPSEGSTGWITIRIAPPTDAVAIDSAKAMRLIRTGSAAISRSAPWSCATARIARPRKVRERNNCNPPISPKETPQGTSSRSGSSIAPRCRLGPI